MRIQRFLAMLMALALGWVVLPTVTIADEEGQDHIPEASPKQVSGVAQLELAYAKSDTEPFHVETVITIKNMSPVPCSAEVQWLFSVGNTSAGASGPMTLNPNQSLEYTTANDGELVAPYILNIFRDSTEDFEGSASIITDCEAIIANATLSVDIDPATGLASSFTTIDISNR